MKTTLKVWGMIAGLGLVILLGLHLFLQYGLTQTMREVVLPQIKAETGLDVYVGRLSINLPNGRLYLNEVELKNPPGFLLENMVSIKRIRLEVDLLSLFKQNPILVKSIEIEQALLNVIRNSAGEINLTVGSATPPPPAQSLPSVEQPLPSNVPDRVGQTIPAPQPAVAKPLPEVLIETLHGRAKIRFVDFKRNQLDLALDLGVKGKNLSTQRDTALPWGELFVTGSLGNQRTSFMTELYLLLAPLADPQVPSFDLSGKVMEIDPRMMEEAYSKLGIRSAPFGLSPSLYCRKGVFEHSEIVLNLTDIVLEEKLADRLGGMASIGSLRFPVPIEGTLQEPKVNVQAALSAAIGGNAQTLITSFLGGMLAKEELPADARHIVGEQLAAKIDEMGENETLQTVLKDLAKGIASDTNAPSSISSDTLIDILGEQVEEIGENEALKSELKNLEKWLFGQ